MYVKTVTYEDYNGVKRTEDFYFNLTKSELYEMELEAGGGMSDALTRIIRAKDYSEISTVFKQILLKAYGEKSPDGKHFMKSEEISRNFTFSPAYDIIYCELLSDADAAAAFANGIMPKEVADRMNSAEVQAKMKEILPEN
jgi:hypothetical protein